MKLLNLDSFYSVMLHNRCNFHCSYCCAEGRKSTHLSHIESNFDRLAELFSMSEPGLIALSGGEPGLTKNIHDFIKGQTRHKFMVFSNASYMPEWFYEDNIKFVIATFHEECISKEKFFENVKRFYDSGKKVIVKIIVKPHLRSLDKELWGKAWEHGIPAHFTPLEYTYWFHDSLLEDIKSSLTSCLYNARFFRSALTCGSSTRCRGGTDKMFEVSADGVISRCSFIHNTDNGNLEVPSFYESARPCAFKNCDC